MYGWWSGGETSSGYYQKGFDAASSGYIPIDDIDIPTNVGVVKVGIYNGGLYSLTAAKWFNTKTSLFNQNIIIKSS